MRDESLFSTAVSIHLPITVLSLLYFVSYSFLPHEFIPQLNMLQTRMKNVARSLLVDNLKRIYSEGLTCFRKSNTLRHFWSSTLEVNNNLDKTVIGRWIETAVENNDSTRIAILQFGLCSRNKTLA
jgi:hypothetical protein